MITPLQREVEPPPVCTRCERAISQLSDHYRCAQCHQPFHSPCIKEHFGWSVNEKPHENATEDAVDFAALLHDNGFQWDDANAVMAVLSHHGLAVVRPRVSRDAAARINEAIG